MNENELQGYRFDKEIGKGVLSKVYLAIKTDTGERFAIKRIDKTFLCDKRYKKYLNNSIFILNKINHENVTKFYGFKITMNYLYIIFEYCNGGDLQSCLSKYMNKYNKPFPEEIVQHIMRQIILGFVYLHSCQILHRYIKLENILVEFNSEEDKNNLDMLKTDIKIAGFDFCTYSKGENSVNDNLVFGLLRIMEEIENGSNIRGDKKNDIWNLGIITYELLIGSPPFEAISDEELIKKIEKGIYKIPSNISLSKEALSFLNGMIRFYPKDRLSIEELAKQYFLTKNIIAFHIIYPKKNEIGPNVVINIRNKYENKINNLWCNYNESYLMSSIEPKETEDIRPFYLYNYHKNKFKDKSKDSIGIEIEKKIDDNCENKGVQIENNFSMGDYLNNFFDEMNKDYYYVKPLLMPTQPPNIIYNSVDPIDQCMITLYNNL